MDYKRIYSSLIDRAKDRKFAGYVERHHIVPKCMGGSNCVTNIARLTPEEHYLAHLLLMKIHPEIRGLVFAVSALTFDKHGRRQNNKMYGWVKRRIAIANSEQKKGGVYPMKGRKHTDAVKEKLSRDKKILGIAPPLRTGVSLTADQKQRLSEFWTGKKKPQRTEEHTEKIAAKIRGTKASDETRARLSEIRTGKKFEVVTCEHCGKIGGASAMGRWHFGNCRQALAA